MLNFIRRHTLPLALIVWFCLWLAGCAALQLWISAGIYAAAIASCLGWIAATERIHRNLRAAMRQVTDVFARHDAEMAKIREDRAARIAEMEATR